jgi:hypothetical protein
VASLNLSGYTAASKILYPGSLEELWFPQAPFLAWVPKEYDFFGANKQLSFILSGIRGSTSFSSAVNGKVAPKFAKMNVTRARDYSIGSIDNETAMATANNKGAVVAAIETQTGAAGYEFGRSQAFQSWSDGSGTRGVVSSYSTSSPPTGADGRISLTSRYARVFFELGMECELKNTAAGGTILAGSFTVITVEDDGTTAKLGVKLNGGMVAPVANNTIARAGDYVAGAGLSNCISGVFAWIPTTAPTAGDSFFGQDRSIHVPRLAGTRVLGAGKTIEEITFDAIADLRINGGSADTLWMNSARAAELQKSMTAKAWVDVQAASRDAKIGFRGFELPTSQGTITVMDDPNCPYGYGLLTKRTAWAMWCLGDYPHYDETDGRRFAREASSDGVEFRLIGYGQLACKSPMDCALIDFDN